MKIEPRSLLVLGGARSGKSRYAQALAEASARQPWLIATAEAKDDEMAARIARHAKERGPRWRLVEAPLELTPALRSTCAANRVVLVDCLTFWLANLMFAGRDAEADIETLARVLPELSGPVVFVSNEVGLGIVPDHALGREFRDIQGRANQRLASVCETVVAVTAGLPRLLKPAPALDIRF